MITTEQAGSYGEELVKNGFLTPRDKTVLLEEIKKESIEIEHPSTVKAITYSSTKLSKETILQFCALALTNELMDRLGNNGMGLEAKIEPKEPRTDSGSRTYGLMNTRAEYKGCITAQTSVTGYTRTKVLNIFRGSGLIDEKVFIDCQSALSSKTVRDEVELLTYMLSKSIYYRYYDFNRKQQEEYINSLVAHELLTEGGRDTLLRSYKAYELKTIPELLKQSPRYRLVDLHGYPTDPHITYPVIFHAVQELLPEFRYSNLAVQALDQKQGDLIRQDLELAFTVGTLSYTHIFFHNYRKQHPNPKQPESEQPRVDQDFHKGINKWLTDIGSSYRLYTINILDSDERAYGSRSVGLLLLKKGEDSLITADPYTISQETFDQRLSRESTAKLLNDLEQNGLFRHLTRQEIDAAKAKIAGTGIGSLEETLLQFPRTIVAFDWETGNLENPYEQLTKEFAAASRGALPVTHITDDYGKGWKGAKEVKYGFTLNGHRYEKLLCFDGDWLDPDFMELLELAMKEQHIDGHLYHIIDDGQAGGYIFLSAEQYRFIQKSYPDLLKGD